MIPSHIIPVLVLLDLVYWEQYTITHREQFVLNTFCFMDLEIMAKDLAWFIFEWVSRELLSDTIRKLFAYNEPR